MHRVVRTIPVLLLGSVLGSPLSAQETRVGEPGFVSPPATIADAAWLIGQWSGEGIAGAEAHESWLAPSGTTMVGTFVQETAEGGIMFTEHMYLMEQDGSLVVSLKHFNPDLSGWEEKGDMVTFRLLAAEPCALFFHALTYRCDADGGMVVAVRMKSDKAEVQELTFRFTRAPQARVTYDCDGSTLKMNGCMADLLQQALRRKDQYLSAALERNSDRPELVALIQSSDTQFDSYRKQECEAVYEDFKDGTIRNIMSLSCSIGLVDERTRTIWQNWLTYGDSSPPILPEPQPTQ